MSDSTTQTEAQATNNDETTDTNPFDVMATDDVRATNKEDWEGCDGFGDVVRMMRKVTVTLESDNPACLGVTKTYTEVVRVTERDGAYTAEALSPCGIRGGEQGETETEVLTADADEIGDVLEAVAGYTDNAI